MTGRARRTGARSRRLLASAAVLCSLVWAAGPAGAQQEAGRTLDQIAGMIQQGQFAAAEKALLGLASSDPRADYLLGFTLIQLYRYEEAEAALRRAVAGEPRNHGWLHALAKSLIEQSKNLAAIEILDRAIALESRPDYHFAKAMCALNTGDLATAEAELERSLAARPRHPEALYKMGKLLVDRGAYADSLSHLESCLELQPGHLEARFLLGLAASRTGDPETARAAFELVLGKIPGHVGALYNLGRVLIQLGRREEGLARLEAFRGLSQLQDQIDYFQRAVKKNARNRDVRLKLASLQLQAGHTEDAIEELLAARQIDPRNAMTYRLLAEALQRLGQSEAAARAAAFAEQLEAERG